MGGMGMKGWEMGGVWMEGLGDGRGRDGRGGGWEVWGRGGWGMGRGEWEMRKVGDGEGMGGE